MISFQWNFKNYEFQRYKFNRIHTVCEIIPLNINLVEYFCK